MTNQNKVTINPQSLIPSYWDGVYVPTEEDLIFLGSRNLEYIKQYWRSEERRAVGQIKRLQERLDLLEGKTVDDIKKMAAEYEHPEFPKIGKVPGAMSYMGIPEPLDEASINRDHFATTFNFCGWCEHADRTACRSHYAITANCNLIPKKFEDGSKLYEESEFRFNTPCALANGNQDLIDLSVISLRTKLSKKVAEKSRISEKVRYITKVMKKAEEKPYLADHRPSDWFEIGEEVVCFIPKNDVDAIVKGAFVTGKVINGYRHGEGCVSICTDRKVHNGDSCDGHGIWLGMSRPEVLHRWEFEYLKTHHDYLEVWTRISDHMINHGFYPGEFISAFENTELVEL